MISGWKAACASKAASDAASIMGSGPQTKTMVSASIGT
eukprot:SAG25_NODE_33_length_20262_cov_33.203293_32_plen_38_part_00